MSLNISSPFIPPDNTLINVSAGGTLQLKPGTQGDILYAGASGVWAKLGVGTAGKMLQTNGAGQNPSWATNNGQWTLIETLSPSAVANITAATFTNYAFFRVLFVLQAAAGNPDFQIQLNADTGTNYNTFYFASTVATNESAQNQIRVGTIESARAVIGEVIISGSATGHHGWINIGADVTRNNGQSFDHAVAAALTDMKFLISASTMTGTIYLMGRN